MFCKAKSQVFSNSHQPSTGAFNLLARVVAFAEFCGTVDCRRHYPLHQSHTSVASKMCCHVGTQGVAGGAVGAEKPDALVASFATTDLALAETWVRQENTAGQVMTMILITNPQLLSCQTGRGHHRAVGNCRSIHLMRGGELLGFTALCQQSCSAFSKPH